MNWNQYRIAFRLLSPLHIGYRKVGNLMQTRYYVPARNLWAALTARITRDCGRGYSGQAYDDIGLLVKKYFRFGYLWPAITRNGQSKVEKWDDLETFFSFQLDKKNCLHELFPNPNQKNSSLFDYLFLDSQQGTAINQSNQAAEEGSLHDIEFIAPYTRGLCKSVYLAGTMWVGENLPEDLAIWENSLRHIRIGGEQSYGWGRVEQVFCDSLEKCSIKPDDFVWYGHIPSHFIPSETENNVQGEIEPLVGWQTQIDGSQKIGKATIALVPGSLIRNENAKFVTGEMGIWKRNQVKFNRFNERKPIPENQINQVESTKS